MKTVIVSVSNNLNTDQRVQKVCNSLHKNGYSILLVGRNYPKTTTLQLPYNTKRLNLLFNKGVLFYAEFNFRLLLFLLFRKKDILLANDMDTLLSNYIASKLQRKKLVFDSHELFSETPEIIHKKKVKKVWLGLEQFLIPKLYNCYTVCNSIANHYKKHYNTTFSVIRNTPIKQHSTKINLGLPADKKIIIYQGAVNVGRGLELMIETMQYLPNFIFLIVGDGKVYDNLKTKVKDLQLESKVHFYGRTNPTELQSITPNAVLGISFEEDLGLNYRYALPNKIFDYMQANVPILISDLPEMKQIVTDYNVGEIIHKRTPKAIANQIEAMVTKDFTSALNKAKKELIWKHEEEKLLTLFKQLQ